MIAWLVLTIQLVAVPGSREKAVPPVGDSTRLSLVVSDTVSETDPIPLCSDDSCPSLFLGRFKNTEVLAGPPVPSNFSARVQMGSPYNKSYRLAMIVEHRDGQEPLIREQAGFSDRSQEACFEREDAKSLGWRPSGGRVLNKRDTICVKR